MSKSQWSSTRLGEVCEVNPPRPKFTGMPDDTAVMFVPMAAVDDVTGTVVAPEERQLGEIRNKSYRTFAPGDVLFAKITPCMENGKAAIVPHITSGIGFGSTEFHVLRPKAGVNPQFIWHLVRQEGFRRAAAEQMTGSVGQARVPSRYLDSFPIVIPNADRQEQIAEMLNTSTESARGATRHLADAQAAIKYFRRSVLAAACSGRLTEDWRMAHGVGEWQRGLARDLCTKVQSGGTPRTGFVDRPGIPFLKVYNIVDQQVDFEHCPQFVPDEVHARALRKSIAYPGDVIMNIVGPPLGKVAIIPPDYPEWNLNQAITIFRPGPKLLVEWLYFFLRSGSFMDREDLITRGSAGQSNISLTQCRSLELPVPSMAEQLEIVRRVSSLLDAVSGLLSRIRAADGQIYSASQAILAKALGGTESFSTDGRRR